MGIKFSYNKFNFKIKEFTKSFMILAQGCGLHKNVIDNTWLQHGNSIIYQLTGDGWDIWLQSPSCFLMKLEIRSCGRCWYSTRTSWDKLIWSLSSLSRSVTQTTAASKASHMVSNANGLICSAGY